MAHRATIAVPALLTVLFAPPPVYPLSKENAEKLDAARYVYIASTRKDGSLGKPAEIWFFSHDGAIYVGTPPTSWRVRRIKGGRPQAKIWIGEPDGPSRFTATEREIAHLPSFTVRGELVNDPKLQEKLYEVFAKKYGSRWNDHESDFRSGFKNGSRVMVKYVPADGSSHRTEPGAAHAAVAPAAVVPETVAPALSGALLGIDRPRGSAKWKMRS